MSCLLILFVFPLKLCVGFHSTDAEGFVIEWRKTKSIVFTTADQNKGNNTKSR